MPDGLTEKMLGAMSVIEEWFGTDGNESFILLAETPDDNKLAAEQYNLSLPEFVERIETDSGVWNKKVYVYSDSGEGIVYFVPEEESGNV